MTKSQGRNSELGFGEMGGMIGRILAWREWFGGGGKGAGGDSECGRDSKWDWEGGSCGAVRIAGSCSGCKGVKMWYK